MTGYRVLFKYGVRHYAHAECGLQKWGAEFLTMLPTHAVGSLPVLVLDNYGLVEAARERLKEGA